MVTLPAVLQHRAKKLDHVWICSASATVQHAVQTAKPADGFASQTAQPKRRTFAARRLGWRLEVCWRKCEHVHVVHRPNLDHKRLTVTQNLATF